MNPDEQIPGGEWVLVTAAAGGVGIAAVQLAKGLSVYSSSRFLSDSPQLHIAHTALLNSGPVSVMRALPIHS